MATVKPKGTDKPKETDLFDFFDMAMKKEQDEEPSYCSICGALVGRIPDRLQIEYLSKGYVLKPAKSFHSYQCKGLRVCFCDDCLTGIGGVDIICKVIEATPEERACIEHESKIILDERKKENREKLKLWSVCIGILLTIIGICCLIWDVATVLIVTGVVLFFVTLIYALTNNVVLW